MPKPRFLTPDQSDQWAVLEEKLKSENNLDWLPTLICWWKDEWRKDLEKYPSDALAVR